GQEDKEGKVMFKVSSPISALKHISARTPVIGESKVKRAKEFTVDASIDSKAVLEGDIFAAKLQFLEGSVIANGNIGVGADGETIASSQGPVHLTLYSSPQSKARTVDFGKLQVDHSLIINAHAQLSLTANMTHSKNGVKLNVLEGRTTKSGNWKGSINFLDTSPEGAGSILELEDNYRLEGNINVAPGTTDPTLGNLIANNAIVMGDIGKTVPLSTLVINDGKIFAVKGEVYLKGETTLNDRAKLIIEKDYTTSRVNTCGAEAEIRV
ncbi:unnamed protein product, partial [Didymodactylos carnosus]